MHTMDVILIIQSMAVGFMTGLIWLTQRVLYPAFRYVSADEDGFHKFHTGSIGPVVGPVMIIELVTAIMLCKVHPWIGWVISALTILLALSTAFIQVPIHNRLATSWNHADIDRLVCTNWIRTILWTAKALLLSYWLWISLSQPS
ncbi:MAG: hypothetical protein AAFQ02_08395 [Bacteroidota bacterium]